MSSRHCKEHHISLTWIWIEYKSIPNFFFYILPLFIGGSFEGFFQYCRLKTSQGIKDEPSLKLWVNSFLYFTILAKMYVSSVPLFVSICHHKNILNLQYFELQMLSRLRQPIQVQFERSIDKIKQIDQMLCLKIRSSIEMKLFHQAFNRLNKHSGPTLPFSPI